MQKKWYEIVETIKTAISIQKALFEKAENLARKMNVSRSRIYALALQDYLRRMENMNLLAQINAAHGDEPKPAEKTLRQKSKRTHRALWMVNGNQTRGYLMGKIGRTSGIRTWIPASTRGIFPLVKTHQT